MAEITKRELENLVMFHIAAGLTPAMREALSWLPADGSEREANGSAPSAALARLTNRPVFEDIEAHLAAVRQADGKRYWKATTLGMKVAAYIEAA